MDRGDATLFTHICERAIAVVAVKRVDTCDHAPRPAIDRNPFIATGRIRGGGFGRVFEIELNVVGHKKIQQPIAIVVQESATSAEARDLAAQPGFFGYISKGSVPIVPVQFVSPIISAEQILISIIIIVTNTYAIGP